MSREYRINSIANKLKRIKPTSFSKSDYLSIISASGFSEISFVDSTYINITGSAISVSLKLRGPKNKNISSFCPILQTVESITADLYSGDGRSLFEAIIYYTRNMCDAWVLREIADQYYAAVIDCIGDVSTTMTILGNFLDRVHGMDNIPNIGAARDLFFQRRAACNLAGMIGLLLSFDMTAGEYDPHTFRANKQKFHVKIDTVVDKPWLVSIDFNNNGTGVATWRPKFVAAEPTRLHDWKTLDELFLDAVSDETMMALSSVGSE